LNFAQQASNSTFKVCTPSEKTLIASPYIFCSGEKAPLRSVSKNILYLTEKIFHNQLVTERKKRRETGKSKRRKTVFYREEREGTRRKAKAFNNKDFLNLKREKQEKGGSRKKTL